MPTKKAILERLTKVERELARLKEDIENLESLELKNISSLKGKFPELSTITSAKIDQATSIWEKSFLKDMNEI